jgi:2-deoxy-D-gluconate 3-dehydrogenase
VIEVNLSSVFRLSKLAGKQMIERGDGGKIVNIASLLSFQGGITVPAYARRKAAWPNSQSARERVGQTPDQR